MSKATPNTETIADALKVLKDYGFNGEAQAVTKLQSKAERLRAALIEALEMAEVLHRTVETATQRKIVADVLKRGRAALSEETAP